MSLKDSKKSVTLARPFMIMAVYDFDILYKWKLFISNAIFGLLESLMLVRGPLLWFYN